MTITKKPHEVWKFTKQETDFNDALKAAEILKYCIDNNEKNIEKFFTNHHKEYNLKTSNHRILTTPQLYGLVTKENFYKLGGKYAKEYVTPAYVKIEENKKNAKMFNMILTEQLLKVKIRPIIDTTDDCTLWKVYPVIASFQVLKKLRDLGINEISIDLFFTYVMRIATHDEIDWAVEKILNNEPVDQNCDQLKSDSRILPMFENIKLFSKDNTNISLNPQFIDYFQNSFINNEEFKELFTSALEDDSKYRKFLYEIHDFNIDLIDPPDTSEEEIIINSDEQEKIMLEINTAHPEKPNPKNIKRLLQLLNKEYENKPVETVQKTFSIISRNKDYADAVKLRDNYTCVICGTLGFMKPDGSRYAEAHHEKELAKNKIDNPNVMICVCPTCHRVIHYGTSEEFEKRKLLNKKQ